MALPIVLHPGAAYATKSNIVFPGTQTQATALETVADTRVDEAYAASGVDNVSIAIAAGSIEIG